MEGNYGSHGTSWADQWDDGPEPVMVNNNSSGTAKHKQKVGEGLAKTKAVASNGMKKLKDGTSVGINWIKTKCNKTNHKP
ncbi:hypothetical protein L6164_011096 [Bauhinia variegata]|uniref:Uncharacterized protein n=1 Tax=Bauhinia variegata TaxID=167791 RepID=A0ACB9P6Z9_BAUVA|nr:hypothetical protein L6164_011096 [Bauhinia variegata]